jgi:hypothetical protein
MADPIREFDLSPHPRILMMLGEINLLQWRCVAELLDNSIDGFLRAVREGAPVQQPQVSVHLPTSDALEAVVRVVDNGPGMSADMLENAMKAGWTSNDPINNLGLFGMGFNIATAKLGRVTTVWSTRSGDEEWVGLRIDFDELTRQRHFRTGRMSRGKSDISEHGTEIQIERLKPDQRRWLIKPANQAQVKKQLQLAYSTMLHPNGKPISFELYINGVRMKGRQHCVWGRPADTSPLREVAVGGTAERTPAYIEIDHRLAPRPFCQGCWQWLPAGEPTCASCGRADLIVSRERRIFGWLGVQRYLDDDDFGIDLIRNGRKIEIQSKELFQWVSDEVSEPEYPIDDQRRRGRLVGEIHVDHCRVSYTKDRFDRSDPAWEEMVEAVRGRGPLRPILAREIGFAGNTSPLFRLYQVFRRSQPHSKTAGVYERLLLVPPEQNSHAVEMAKKYREGVSEYQSDVKWWDLVVEADNNLLTGNQPPLPQPPAPGGGPLPPPIPGFTGGEQPLPPPAPTLPERVPIASLTREYVDPVTGARWDVRAFRADDGDIGLGSGSKAWSVGYRADEGTHVFLANVAHSIFRSVTLTPLDALLSELAWSAADGARQTRGASPNFTESYVALRNAYGGSNALDPRDLNSSARSVLRDICRRVDASLDTADRAALFEQLSSHDQRSVLSAMLARGVNAPSEAVAMSGFLEFLPAAGLARFFDAHPDLFFDGKCWDELFETVPVPPELTEERRAELIRRYGGMMADAIWLAECDPEALATSSRERLLRAGVAVGILVPTQRQDA